MYVYIEKYDRVEGLLIADFVSEEEHREFCLRIGYENKADDNRTMLYVSNLIFDSGIIPKEGQIYEMPSKFLEWEWIKEEKYSSNFESSIIYSFKEGVRNNYLVMKVLTY